MSGSLLDGKPGVYLKHSGHGGGSWFPDNAALAYWKGHGWEPADPPSEDDEEVPKDSPESPAPKKTSKAAKAADKGEVTGG